MHRRVVRCSQSCVCTSVSISVDSSCQRVFVLLCVDKRGTPFIFLTDCSVASS